LAAHGGRLPRDPPAARRVGGRRRGAAPLPRRRRRHHATLTPPPAPRPGGPRRTAARTGIVVNLGGDPGRPVGASRAVEPPRVAPRRRAAPCRAGGHVRE